MAATSQTYNFAHDPPSFADIGLYALNRVGVRRTMVEQDHIADVAMAANLVLSDWSTEQPNLWSVKRKQLVLQPGVPGYVLDGTTLMVLNCWLRIGNPDIIETVTDEFNKPITDDQGNPVTTMTPAAPPFNERVIYGVSRDEYAAFPTKWKQDIPTVYWVNRQARPEITFYPTPDGKQVYTLFYFAIEQSQDAVINNGQALDLPYRAYKAFVDALVAELSLTYMPQAAQVFQTFAMGSRQRLNTHDRENTAIYIVPSMGRYFR